jgi:hypothetical protein
VKPLREANTIVLQRFDDFFTRRGLMVADLSAAIIDRATELRARSGFGTPDALHLATAVELAADVFLTGDDRLERCDSVRVEGGPVMSDRRTWDQEADREESMTDEFLDCTGRVRTFRLSVYAAGRFLEAVELLGGGERGLRFVLPAGPDGEIPWGRMRQALRDWLGETSPEIHDLVGCNC